MTKLIQLIDELCPNGVEVLNLENCCNILDKKRKPITKSAREAGEYPYYGANGIQDYVSDYIFDGTFILVGEDGSVLTPEGTPVVNWAEGKIWVNNHAHIVEQTDGVLLRYLFHYLQTIDVRDLIHGNIPKLTQGDFRQLKIAVPPLPVQSEIVRILDNFTELTAELSANLSAEIASRRQQYRCYRNALLACRDNISLVKLADMANMFKGEYITKKDSKEGKFPVILGGQEPAYYIDRFNHCGEIVTVSRSGASAGFVSYWNEPIFLTDGFGLEAKPNVVNTRYLFYALKNIESDLNNMKRGAGVPHISGETLKKITLTLPCLDEQNSIVSILDRLDALCNDSTDSLLAEIEARQKQYEYYRDQLLTFKELDENAG